MSLPDDPAARLELAQHRLDAMQDIGRALASTLDLDELLQLIMHRVTDLMVADRSTLYLYEPDQGELWSRVLQGGEVRSLRLRVGEGIAGWVAEHGEPLNIVDAYADARFNAEVDRASGYRTRSILCQPLRSSRGDVAAVIQVLNKRGGPFTDDDEALLSALGGQVAIAIENARLYQSVISRNRELDLLYTIEREVSEAGSLEELLGRLIVSGKDLCDAKAGAILLTRADSAELFVSSSASEELTRLRVGRGEGIGGWVAIRGESVISDDPKTHAKWSPALAERTGIDVRTLACVPLVGEEGSFGAVELYNKKRGAFDDEDVRRLTLVAGQAARAVSRQRDRDQRQRSERLSAIGQLISSVLHDLRSPMTIVSGYAQLMGGMDDSAERQEHVDVILQQLDLMEAMTKEVLAFARGEASVLVRKVYVHKFVKEIARNLTHEFTGLDVELVVDARYDGIAYFDELKMRRVIHNIARNAAQAMPQGGRFTFRMDRDGSDFLLELADDGPGIPAEMEGRLFEAFSTVGKKGGTGLGLAIVKKIVDEHGGSITYRSEAGKGTTFVIRLPLEKPAP